jgi:uncharacterized membrane protein YfhO
MAGRFSLFPLDRKAVPAYQLTALGNDGFDSIMNLYDDARPFYYEFHPIPDFVAEPEKLSLWYKNLTLLNVKYLLSSDQEFPKHKNYTDITESVSKRYHISAQGKVIELSNPRPRFFFTTNGSILLSNSKSYKSTDYERVKSMIEDEKFDLNSSTVFLSDTKSKSEFTFPNVYILPENKFNVNKYIEIPGKLDISFHTNSQGYFVYSNTYYPGWEAKLNNKKTDIYIADSVVKGLIIPEAGDYHLIMEYKPKSFYVGFLITSIFVLASTILVINSFLTKK